MYEKDGSNYNFKWNRFARKPDSRTRFHSPGQISTNEYHGAVIWHAEVYYLNARTNQRTMMEDRLPGKLMNNLRFRILETEPLIF